ncbi:MAG: hypothetical protein OXC30_06225 [Alphaproteobacteria bacterium]|nr:hypothetical protein [Alphaproteobacteria bacterium]
MNSIMIMWSMIVLHMQSARAARLADEHESQLTSQVYDGSPSSLMDEGGAILVVNECTPLLQSISAAQWSGERESQLASQVCSDSPSPLNDEGGAILAVNDIFPKRNSIKLKNVLKRFCCLMRLPSPLKSEGSDDSASQCELIVDADTGLSASQCALVVNAETRISASQCFESLRRDHLLIRSWLRRMKQLLNFLIEDNVKLDNPELSLGGEDLALVRQYREFRQGLQTEVSSFMNQINVLYDAGQEVFADFWHYDVEDGVIIEKSIPDAEVRTFRYGDDDYSSTQELLEDLINCFTRFGNIQKRQQQCISDVQSAMTSAGQGTGDNTHDNQGRKQKIAAHIFCYAQYINDLQTATTKYSALFAQFLQDEQGFDGVEKRVQQAIQKGIQEAMQQRRVLARRSLCCPCLGPCFLRCCGEVEDECDEQS